MLARARGTWSRVEENRACRGRYWLGIDIGGTFTDFTLYDTATPPSPA